MPGRIRSLLTPTEVRPAGRSCKCAHDRRHQIRKGETRIVVNNAGTPGQKGYCADCGRAMLLATRKRLEALEEACGEKSASELRCE